MRTVQLIAASMPSGVEHSKEAPPVGALPAVLIAASMPSGVEHRSGSHSHLPVFLSDRRLDAFGR